jgi:hypothetical protein
MMMKKKKNGMTGIHPFNDHVHAISRSWSSGTKLYDGAPPVVVVDDGENNGGEFYWSSSSVPSQQQIHGDCVNGESRGSAAAAAAAAAATTTTTSHSSTNMRNWRDINTATKQFCESVENALMIVKLRGHKFRSPLEGGKLRHLRVVFRCYGVNLGRNGRLEWVAVAFEPPVLHAPVLYLVDVGEKRNVATKYPNHHHVRNHDAPFTSACWRPPSPWKIKRIAALRDLFVNERILKVAHDCRRDSDALQYKIGATLGNIHDTYCFHQIMHYRNKNDNHPKGRTSIKSLLQQNGFLAEHVPHDEDAFYEQHADYWRTRPITEDMQRQMLAETQPLFDIASKQKFWLKQSDISEYRAARHMSRLYNFQLRTRKNIILKCQKNDEEIEMDMQFIERKAEATLFKVYDGSPQRLWSVYYKNFKDLLAVSSEFSK